LVARVVVKSQGGTHVAHSTDSTWKTAIKEFPQWQKSRFNDVQWLAARSFGAMGATLPWGNEVTVAGAEGRFRIVPDFRVEWVVEGTQTGSLISMTFNEFGDIIAARENGSLVIVYDSDSDGILDSVDTLCDEIKNCQGLLCVSGRVFAIGQGPQGTALYRLSDEDHDGKTERIDALVKFTGEMGEHGPHSLALGPDGLIYMVVGNFARPEKVFEETSPLRKPYEGDLVTPRYEDAGGHAVGIKSPGGTIIRTDSNGSAVELVASGLQNPYDLAFNSAGQLFTADSDMEWDLGFSWYRPTRVNHIVPGGDFGWRSGWAKWPDYYLDSLPPLVELGRGSPTGLEVYNHFMFPKRYHDAVFVCDWSRGRILAVKMKPFGATYKASSEVFLEGQPLNVTDIAVGPDGSLYFCTGGRETEGGIYRVVWNGKVPPELANPGDGVAGALRQPQLNSAWARQRIATIKQQTGKTWGPELRAIV
jgi:putative membrane-bound dehydrogenase-like protein